MLTPLIATALLWLPIASPPAPPASFGAAFVYSLRYDGIDSIIDTDELGDDEIYSIVVLGIGRTEYNPISKKFVYVQKKYTVSKRGPTHTSLEKGQSRMSNVVLYVAGEDSPITSLIAAVAIYEKDGGEQAIDQDYFTGKIKGDGNLDFSSPVAFQQSALKRLKDAQDHGPMATYLSDDRVGVKALPIKDVMAKATEKKGWHAFSVTIDGDGGRFRLRFSFRAEPKVGYYELPNGQKVPPQYEPTNLH
jgi:hypothetical protein